MFPIAEIDDATFAFPATVKHLMPAMEDIPDEFKRHQGTKWNEIFSTWFYFGLKETAEFYPKPDVDAEKAFRHICTVMRSFEPQHEHKEAACAFLMSEWFEEIGL